jgi:hypothetical protein
VIVVGMIMSRVTLSKRSSFCCYERTIARAAARLHPACRMAALRRISPTR